MITSNRESTYAFAWNRFLLTARYVPYHSVRGKKEKINYQQRSNNRDKVG